MSIKLRHIEITIDGQTFIGTFNEITEPEDQQRLIFSFNSPWGPWYVHADQSLVERTHTFKTAFAKRFPDAPKFRETSTGVDITFFFSGATEEHIKWAKAAMDCGMIDTYIVDYVPS